MSLDYWTILVTPADMQTTQKKRRVLLYSSNNKGMIQAREDEINAIKRAPLGQ